MAGASPRPVAAPDGIASATATHDAVGRPPRHVARSVHGRPNRGRRKSWLIAQAGTPAGDLYRPSPPEARAVQPVAARDAADAVLGAAGVAARPVPTTRTCAHRSLGVHACPQPDPRILTARAAALAFVSSSRCIRAPC